MSAIIDTELGVVSFVCDTCWAETTVSVKLENGLDWRLKDGTKAFCSYECEIADIEKEAKKFVSI